MYSTFIVAYSTLLSVFLIRLNFHLGADGNRILHLQFYAFDDLKNFPQTSSWPHIFQTCFSFTTHIILVECHRTHLSLEFWSLSLSCQVSLCNGCWTISGSRSYTGGYSNLTILGSDGQTQLQCIPHSTSNLLKLRNAHCYSIITWHEELQQRKVE